MDTTTIRIENATLTVTHTNLYAKGNPWLQQGTYL
jgi:hypothetical protein